jgi:hypothetical protein
MMRQAMSNALSKTIFLIVAMQNEQLQKLEMHS